MTDAAFLRALEACDLPESDFGHAEHVRATYLYLRDSDFAGALTRTRTTIRKYARHFGKSDRYHETITVAYVALIARHMFEHGDGGGEELKSDIARRVFVLPRSMPPWSHRCA